MLGWPYDGEPRNYTNTLDPTTGWELYNNTTLTATFNITLGVCPLPTPSVTPTKTITPTPSVTPGSSLSPTPTPTSSGLCNTPSLFEVTFIQRRNNDYIFNLFFTSNSNCSGMIYEYSCDNITWQTCIYNSCVNSFGCQSPVQISVEPLSGCTICGASWYFRIKQCCSNGLQSNYSDVIQVLPPSPSPSKTPSITRTPSVTPSITPSSTSIPSIPSIPCNGSLNTTGGVGYYEIDTNVGTGIGTGFIRFNAGDIPDRFQIFWNNNLVADSLFVGDYLNGNGAQRTSYVNGILGTTSYSKYLYVGQAPGGPFIPNGTVTIQSLFGTNTFTPAAIAPNTSLRSGGSAGGQLNVSANYPSAGAFSSDGDVRLFFNKTTAFPTTIKIVAMGGKTATGGGTSGWYIYEVGCPGVQPPPITPTVACNYINTEFLRLTYGFSPNATYSNDTGGPLVPWTYFTESFTSACNAFTLYEQALTIPTNFPYYYYTLYKVRALAVGEKIYNTTDNITDCTPHNQLITGYFISNPDPRNTPVNSRQITHVVDGIIQSTTLCN